jgi:aminoglycoside N3'-acetyltransferase
MERHDRVLFKLCALRREIMSLMREKAFDFPKEDYFALRELVRITNETIHNYNEFKNSEFSVSKCIEYGRSAKRIDKEIQELRVENEVIAKLYDRFAFTMFIGVLTFIPWPDLFLKVFPLVIRVAAALGKVYFSENIKRMIDFASWIQQKSQEYAYR